MQVNVSDIKIPARIRKDIGNLEPLMESLGRCGQLNPITVTRDFELVAGYRRLTCAKRLGWKMIDATIVDGVNQLRLLEMEMAENVYRKDFDPDELMEGLKKLEELRHPKLGTRIGNALKGAFSKLAFWKHRKTKQNKDYEQQSVQIQYATPKTEDEPGNFGV